MPVKNIKSAHINGMAELMIISVTIYKKTPFISFINKKHCSFCKNIIEGEVLEYKNIAL